MSDYKKMYLTLVDEVANTIDNLKSAMEKAEDIYIETDESSDEPEAADMRTDNSKMATE